MLPHETIFALQEKLKASEESEEKMAAINVKLILINSDMREKLKSACLHGLSLAEDLERTSEWKSKTTNRKDTLEKLLKGGG